jgi:Lrp/AsnC family leucine-responsive transcriptional regulator
MWRGCQGIRASFATFSLVIDQVDREILTALARDGRMSYRELGELTHLSANAVADRVRRLVRAGVVEGFTVKISPAALGLTLSALIDLRLTPTAEPVEFEQGVRELAEVQRLWHVTGPFDYQVHVGCTGAEHLDRLIRQLKREHHIAETQTRVILRDLGGRGLRVGQA